MVQCNRSEMAVVVATAQRRFPAFSSGTRSLTYISVMSAALGDQPHGRSIDPILLVEALAPGQRRYVTVLMHSIVFSKTQALP